MKFVVQVFVILVLSFLFELFFPWWTIAIAAFLGGWIFDTKANFGAGFLAVAILWLGMILFIESSAVAPLSQRVATLLMVNKPVLYIVTSGLGGIVAGFASMAGGALNRKRRRSSGYY